MTDLEALATIVLGVLAVGGVAVAVLKLSYRRGGDEREWTKSIDANTESNRELVNGLRDFKEFTVTRLHEQAIDHERLKARVDVVETRVDVIDEKMKG